MFSKEPKNQRNKKCKNEKTTGRTRNWETEITTEVGFSTVHPTKVTPRVTYIDVKFFKCHPNHSKQKLSDYNKNRESQNFSQV